MSEGLNPLRAALYAAISGNPAFMATVTGIHWQVAPSGAAFPFVAYSYQGGEDLKTFTGSYAGDLDFLFKVVDRGKSVQRAGTIAEALNAILLGTQIVVEGFPLMYLERLSPVSTVEPETGTDVLYYQEGGIYRIVRRY